MMAQAGPFVLHLIWNSIDFYMLHLYMQRVYGLPVRFKKWYWPFAVFVIVSIAVVSRPVDGFYNIVDMVLASYLFLVFFKKNLMRQVLFSICLLVIDFAWIFSLAELFNLYPLAVFEQKFCYTLLSHLGIWGFSFIIQLFTKMEPDDTIPKMLWVVLISIAAMSISVIIVSIAVSTYFYDDNNSLAQLTRMESLLSSLFILFINLLIFYIYDRVARYRQMINENLLLNQQIVIQTKYYHEMDEMQQRVRSIKHDMKNQIGTLSYLLKEGKYEEAGQFSATLEGHVEQVSQVVMTGNESVDAVLNLKTEELRRAGVPVTADIAIPAGLVFGFEQAVAIFGNLFDNAKEASLALPGDQREVLFRLKYDNQILYLTMTNRCQSGLNNQPLQTGKNDKFLHGIGLKNIRSFVEAAGGVMEIVRENGWFTVRIVLYQVECLRQNQK